MRLRIISGIYGGRYIYAPDSKFTRPTTDRVRETMFNILNNIFDFDDKRILDIYAGSGSLGFECLSRGAAQVDFIEKNPNVALNLSNNIKLLGVEESCNIHKTSALVYSSKQIENRYDLIIADPPFFEFDIYKVVENIVKNNFLFETGLMIIERSKQTIDKDINGIGQEPFKKIGDACLYKILAR
jgi:16S rRNA (guanine966-N2)-methyltransferase